MVYIKFLSIYTSHNVQSIKYFNFVYNILYAIKNQIDTPISIIPPFY